MSLDHWSSRVRRRWMIPLLASLPVAAVVVGLGACLPVPLGDPETSAVDPRLAGVWTNDFKEAGGTCLVALPYDARTYFVHVVDVERAGAVELPLEGPVSLDRIEQANQELRNRPWTVRCKGHYKAWLTKVKDATFVTLSPLSLPGGADDVVHVVARLNLLNDDKLFAHGVDAEHPALKKAFQEKDARDAVLKAVAENVADENLYGDAFGVTYERVADKGVLRAIAEAFSSK